MGHAGAIVASMTRIIRRTITTTIIETLTLIWVHTDNDDAQGQNETTTEQLRRSHVSSYSVSRVTASCHTAVLPVYGHTFMEEEVA